MSKDNYIEGRGAQINPSNPFDHYEYSDNGLLWEGDDEIKKQKKTQYISVYPKSIINKVDSPDIGNGYSMNPYQGCEHGCVYCYARNSHTYWGYSAGIEFEQKILVKESAPDILLKKITSKSWQPKPIMLSGNTDCYQPAERRYQITRRILQILLDYRHPVGIITKSALIIRDLDILSEMAERGLVHVAISITSLDDTIRQRLEPRAATGDKRLMIVKRLSEAGIPVNVMFAPVIPSINDHELLDVAEQSAAAGARSFNHIIVRLNGQIDEIFKDWLRRNYPDRYDRVIHQIENLHGGKTNDSRFGVRMRGEGHIADIIKQQSNLAREKFFKGRSMPPYDLKQFLKKRDPQLRLFEEG